MPTPLSNQKKKNLGLIWQDSKIVLIQIFQRPTSQELGTLSEYNEALVQFNENS